MTASTPEFSKEELSVQLIDPRKLIEAPNNNKIHTEDSTRRLAMSFKDIGQASPILVDKDLVIISGHGRTKAAISLGWEKAKVLVLPVSREQAIKMRLAENLTSSQQYDTDAIARELKELRDLDIDFDLTALTVDDGMANLLDTTLSDDMGLSEDTLSEDVASDVTQLEQENEKIMELAESASVKIADIFETKAVTADAARDLRDMIAVMMDESGENDIIKAMRKWYKENLT